jgi:hypothetical protein
VPREQRREQRRRAVEARAQDGRLHARQDGGEHGGHGEGDLRFVLVDWFGFDW